MQGCRYHPVKMLVSWVLYLVCLQDLLDSVRCRATGIGATVQVPCALNSDAEDGCAHVLTVSGRLDYKNSYE
jgi:hypothetical protein